MNTQSPSTTEDTVNSKAPKIESPDTKLARQRAKDRAVQRVRKIGELARFIKEPMNAPRVRFRLDGAEHEIPSQAANILAMSMLKEAVAQHEQDPLAGDLSKIDRQTVKLAQDMLPKGKTTGKPKPADTGG